jgi:hypothetical protein
VEAANGDAAGGQTGDDRSVAPPPRVEPRAPPPPHRRHFAQEDDQDDGDFLPTYHKKPMQFFPLNSNIEFCTKNQLVFTENRWGPVFHPISITQSLVQTGICAIKMDGACWSQPYMGMFNLSILMLS